jgi:uncharacterized protein (TIGR02466 family)
MNIDYYFPTPIWWTDSNLDNDSILNYCYNLKKSDPEGRQISNRGGWQSAEINACEDLPELVSFIMSCVPRTLVDYGFDVDRTSTFFGNSWVNINRKDNTNQIHVHHGSYLSGVYYVKATPESGNIFFYRNFDQSFITTSYAKVVNHTSISGGVVYYPPKTGRLLLFPSNLMHSVDASTDDEDRISIAFNVGIRYA